jgi:hypothetical protein
MSVRDEHSAQPGHPTLGDPKGSDPVRQQQPMGTEAPSVPNTQGKASIENPTATEQPHMGGPSDM